MEIEVLHIDECPGWEAALVRTREAAAMLGLADTRVEERVVRTESLAAESAFAGSPTIVVDGTDLFVSDGGTDALACRIYRTEHGLAPAPTLEQIVDALRSRALASASEAGLERDSG